MSYLKRHNCTAPRSLRQSELVTVRSLLFGLLVACWGQLTTSAQLVDFNRDIRPILADHCYACHGPDEAARMADLRLDDRQAAIEMGAIVPGDPESSELLNRINSDDDDLLMPPAEAHKPLTNEQRQLLKRWIDDGASFSEHWAWIAPQKPALPVINNDDWSRNPIDLFVLARLKQAELQPAPEADLPVLLRRVTLDLTGLPPDPARIQQVLNDPTPDRYERYVEWLLAQPQWGEHRARYWLDYARYADTNGIHFDNFREMWAYRDWLIEAFNRNLPFDQFTIEQIAGDLMPEPTLDQRIATGFNRCNITTNEGGVIEEEYRVLYARDRVETTMQVWTGLTVGCAVCHDHKYDPFTQRDFYQLAAFFNNTTQPVMDGNVRDTPPVVTVPLRQDRTRFRQLVEEIDAAQQRLSQHVNAVRPKFDQHLAAGDSIAEWLQETAVRWPTSHLELPLLDGPASTVSYRMDGDQRSLNVTDAMWTDGWLSQHAWKVDSKVRLSLPDAADFERDQPFTVSFWIQPQAMDGAVLARMKEGDAYRGWDIWLQGGFIAMHLVHRWPEDALKVVAVESPLQAGKWQHVAVSYDGSSAASGVRIWVDGTELKTRPERETLTQTIRTDVPLRIGSRHNSSPVNGSAIQDIRILKSALETAQVAHAPKHQRSNYLLSLGAPSWTEQQRNELFDWYLNQHDSEFETLSARLSQLRSERVEIERRGTVAHVMQEREGVPMAHILSRGAYDQRLEEVQANTPASLPPMREELAKNRMGLALWLLDEQNPLTARVTVNRFWQEVFGQGLVVTSGDFGTMGQLPSHPELLDYLAIWFRENRWDVKALFRLMVTSAAYRQSAAISDEKLQRDPDNALLSRGPRFRMDAEMIRDVTLASTGTLVETIGGPSVKPYQPDGVWEAVAMPESNTRNYQRDEGENVYRRSMYTIWKRAAPPASMEIFNAPNREVCTVRRERTNTPLQALAALNDVQLIEAARVLAESTVNEISQGALAEEAAIDSLGWRLLGRSWTDEERSIVRQSLQLLRRQFAEAPTGAYQLIRYGQRPPREDLDAVETAAWTMLINQLLNLDEFLCK